MRERILNRLRNQKEWLELHGVPLLGRISDRRLFARYAMRGRAVAELWDTDPDALYVAPLVKPHAVVLDVGANLGTFCYTVLQTRRPVQLVAVEPIPVLAKRLRKLFPGTMVLETTLSDVTGVGTFRIPYIAGRRCYTRGSLAAIVDTSRYREIEVRSDLLDNVLPATGLPTLDLVKIDVEGHEREVLAGGLRSLRRHLPLLLVEIEQRHHGAEPIASVWEFIEAVGYRGFYLNRESLEFDSIETFDVAKHQRVEDMGTRRYINNFLFVPRATATQAWRTELSEHLRRLLSASHRPQ